jgi:hypothetical protein
MNRERSLKMLLVLVGFIFCATIYPLMTSLWQAKQAEYGPMMLSLYVTLGIFLLLAAPNPSANRSLIAFTAWSNFAHAAVMAGQAIHDTGERVHLVAGSIILVIIGVALIALVPPRPSQAQASVTTA